MYFVSDIDKLTLSKVKHQDRSLKNGIKRCFTQKTLKVYGGQFSYYQFPLILKSRKELSSQTIIFQRNYEPSILCSMVHLSLPNLVELNLGMNNIHDLTLLMGMQAPNMKKLNLCDNRLANIKTLRKLPFKLEQLDISGNHIRELTKIAEILFAENLISLKLQINLKSPKLDESVSKLVKIQSNNVKKISKFLSIQHITGEQTTLSFMTQYLAVDFHHKQLAGFDLYTINIVQQSEHQRLIMATKVVENYTLSKKIGAGQYGSVFLAEHKIEPGLFAVKVMNLDKFKQTPKLEEFTNNEIAILSKIDHPNIIKLIQVLKTETHYFLVYEYCEGGTLEQLVKKERSIPEKLALPIFHALREAFIVLFKSNILHRDLKPSNILFKNGIVKVADFGFCKELVKQNDLTQTMVGSPIYMAPQVLKGEMYDAKADIWSLGVILYEMLYGICPFMQNSIPKLISLHQIHSIDFPNNQNISQQTISFIRKMLTLNAQKRIDPYQFIDYVLPHMQQNLKMTYKEAGKYMRKALIYLTQTLEELTARINELPYLRMAFLVFKIINSFQEDTTAISAFWQNLEIDIRGQSWEEVILLQAKIAKPYGEITRQAIKKYDTGLKSKVELQTKYIDVRYYLESTQKIQQQSIKLRLLNCFMFNRHFSLVKEKRQSKWIDPTNDGVSLKEKYEICNNYAKYY